MNQLIDMKKSDVIVPRAYNQLLVAITVKVTKSQSIDIVTSDLHVQASSEDIP